MGSVGSGNGKVKEFDSTQQKGPDSHQLWMPVSGLGEVDQNAFPQPVLARHAPCGVQLFPMMTC